MENYGIVIHGGAGAIQKEKMTPGKEFSYNEALTNGIAIGNEILKNGGSALEAVEKTVVFLEDCPLFNAGRGSVFSHEGKHEMDAAIMCGKQLSAGAVTNITNIKNPIALAHKVQEDGQYVMLSGRGASEFAKSNKMRFMPDAYFYTEQRFAQVQKAIKSDMNPDLDHNLNVEAVNKFGTVGAVALDQKGNLAAATSTGGLTNKKYGRIGDSAIIGAGTYANNETCAISCTGYGEYFMRGVVAYDISCLIEYKNLSLEEACELVINKKQADLGGRGGLIAIDAKGNIALPYSTEGMYRAWQLKDQEKQIKIWS